MTAAFPRWRLEGRALEHGFAGTPGSGIRMKTAAGVWKVVHSQAIREQMNEVAKQVRSGMGSKGVRILGADCPCFLVGDRPTRSVDLRIKVGDVYGAVELKFSRFNVDTAMRNAKFDWLLSAARLPGFFFMGGRRYKMNLQAVGCLGVSLSRWRLELTKVNAGRRFFTASGELREEKRRYASGAAKRARSERLKQREKAWRKGPTGKRLKLKNMATYWKTPKGRAARKRALNKR